MNMRKNDQQHKQESKGTDDEKTNRGDNEMLINRDKEKGK